MANLGCEAIEIKAASNGIELPLTLSSGGTVRALEEEISTMLTQRSIRRGHCAKQRQEHSVFAEAGSKL